MWSPDPTFEQHLGRLITRAFEEAREAEQQKGAAALEQLAARGLGSSGAVLNSRAELAAEAFLTAGRRSIAESIDAFEATYGSMPAGATEWLRSHITKRFESYASSRAESFADGRSRMEFPAGHFEALQRHFRERMQRIAIVLQRDLEIELGPREMRARLAAIARNDLPSAAPGPRTVDAFISHAGEDKSDVARPLSEVLKARGFSIWLDETELIVGHSLYASIDDGLRRCRFGVVIISPHFFAKQWPPNELHALAALGASEGRNKILPVWHDVDRDCVARFSPLLVDLWAANTREGIDKVADDITRALRV